MGEAAQSSSPLLDRLNDSGGTRCSMVMRAQWFAPHLRAPCRARPAWRARQTPGALACPDRAAAALAQPLGMRGRSSRLAAARPAVSRGGVLTPVPEATDSGSTLANAAAGAAAAGGGQAGSTAAPARRRSAAGGASQRHPASRAGRLQFYSGSMSVYVLCVVIVAATSGVLYGYDLAVAGGVQVSAPCISSRGARVALAWPSLPSPAWRARAGDGQLPPGLLP